MPPALRNAKAMSCVLGVSGSVHLFNPRWPVKAEYHHVDLGSDKLSATADQGTIYEAAATLDAEHAYHTVRLGLKALPGNKCAI